MTAVGLLDDAIGAVQGAIAPREAAHLPYNPTLAATNAPAGEPRPREPIKKSAVADSTGVATITLDPVEPNTTWLLDYIVVTSTSTQQCDLDVYENNVALANLIDGTGKGNKAIGWYQPARRISGTVQLVFQWTGCTIAASCTLRVEYRVEAAA